MDSFDEVIKRNNFDLDKMKNLFYKYCELNNKNPDELINKATILILKSVGLIAKTNWEFVKNRIDFINSSEKDYTVIFPMTAGLLLGWEKIEKEDIKKLNDFINLNK